MRPQLPRGMDDKAKPGKPATAPSREQKLAAALRANLRRRKAPPPAPPPAPHRPARPDGGEP
ncbi:MAG: hypothetical protein JSR86_07850 [Proteobacteria bacterium]|nr:hypothetical protein [Pseudomonadota bacterium]